MSANAFNLARRMSSRNEPDFLQEDMMGNSPTTTTTTPPNTPPSRRECFDMLNKVCPDSPLPKECDIYSDVTMANLQRRNTDPHNQNIAFAGMNAGEANAARAARDRGFLHHAQIQRRMTAGGKKRIW